MTISAFAFAALVLAAAQQPQQKQATKPAQQPAKSQPAQKTPAPAAKTPAKTPATKAVPPAATQKGAPQKGQKTAPKTAPDTAPSPPPTILREAFAYEPSGRRDPFNSLLTTNELRPTMSDLRVTGIAFDPSGRRSVATLRDLVTNAQYRVFTGTTLGRMRVSGIRPHVVVFTIEEFGTTRQDSLVLGDTTKARPR